MFTREDESRAVALEYSNGRIRAICGVSIADTTVRTICVEEEFIVDTGAPLCIFPSRIWKRWQNDLRFYRTEAEVRSALTETGLNPKWAQGIWQIRGFGGTKIRCEVGKINLHPIGENGRTLDMFECLAKFAVDDSEDRSVFRDDGTQLFTKEGMPLTVVDIPNPIIGLSGITGGGLCLDLADQVRPSIHLLGESSNRQDF